MGTLNLEQHQLTGGGVPHNPPPSSLHKDRELVIRGCTDASAYVAAAKELDHLFRGHFKKYESGVSAAIKSASPA